MRRTRVALFVHMVWGTWDRLPLLVGDTEPQVYHCIEATCVEMGADVIAIGGVDDHVHLLARLPATISVADLVKQVKGASAHLATHEIAPGRFFKWQGGYAAFSVGQSQVEAIRDYVARQKEHHRAGFLISEWEDDTES